MASPEHTKLVELLRKNAPPVTPYEVMKNNVDAMRANFVAAMSSFKVADDVDVETVDAGGVPAEYVTAPGADRDRAILYLHGGGYVIGSVATHRHMIGELSRAAMCRVLALDYRLAPEHRHPAAVEDAVTGFRWLVDQGINPGRSAIAGDSAGGGLTVATLVALRDSAGPLPAAAVPMSPWIDLQGLGASMESRKAQDPMVEKMGLTHMARLYVGDDGDLRAPLAAPLYANLSGLPPLLIHVGDWETLLDDATRLAERARAAGVDTTLDVWPEMIHIWHLFYQMLPEGRQAIERVGTFVRQHTT